MRIALAERRNAGEAVEQFHEFFARLELGLDMAPLGRLLGKPGEEARALGLAEAGRAHEFEAGPRRGGFLVGIDQAQHGRGGTGKTQLVGKHVADEPRAFPGRPAFRGRAHGIMAHVEMVGIAFANFGMTVRVAPGLAEPFGSQDHAIILDFELDITPDRLVLECIVRVPRMDIRLMRGGRRGQLVDQRQQPVRAQFLCLQPERMEHAHQAFAAFGQLGIGHAAGNRHAERDDHPDIAGMEGRMRRARIPDEIIQALCPRPGDGLVDPALLVARGEPGGDDIADPRGSKVQNLEAGTLRQPFGEELPEDLAGLFVSPDQRGDFEDEAFRARISVELRALVIDPVREPVREHIEPEMRAISFGSRRIGKKPAR